MPKPPRLAKLPPMSEIGENTKRPKTGGRQKGTPNKFTVTLKEAILRAANEAGGGGENGTVEYLTLQAYENPAAFMSLLGKVLPMQVAHSGSVDSAVTTIRIVGPDELTGTDPDGKVDP